LSWISVLLFEKQARERNMAPTRLLSVEIKCSPQASTQDVWRLLVPRLFCAKPCEERCVSVIPTVDHRGWRRNLMLWWSPSILFMFGSGEWCVASFEHGMLHSHHVAHLLIICSSRMCCRCRWFCVDGITEMLLGYLGVFVLQIGLRNGSQLAPR